MSDDSGAIAWLVLVIVVIAAVVGFAVVHPFYKVWKQEMDGKAELAEASYSKQVAVEVAKAKSEAAEYEAQAHIKEAQGIASANEIIAGSITPEYLEYVYITGLQDNTNKVIYIPTEAGMPIIEAPRLTMGSGAST